jgi:hypothetical protein
MAITPPRGRVGSRSGVARGFHRCRNRVHVSVVQPSKRTSGVSTTLRYLDVEDVFGGFFREPTLVVAFAAAAR